MKGSEADVLHGVAHCTAFIDFLLPSYDGGGEDVYIGVQFPFRVFKMTNPRLTFDDPSAGSLEAPINDYDVSVVEEDGLVNTIFYMEFTRPRTTEAREYNLALYFEWEGIVSREGYSMFSFTLPVALGVEDGAEFRHPCTQNSNARYLYYAETLGLRVELNMPTNFEIKQTYPQVEVMRADTGGDSRNLTWEISAESQYFKATQLVSADFEDTSLSETRSRLMFDSGLYMGLGVALIFNGIHEAVRVLAERRGKT
jgi:hypothetical protein